MNNDTVPPPPRHYHIMGGIGVGKSTLIESFRAAGMMAIAEDIPAMLSDYLTNRDKFGYMFQSNMLEKAVTRSLAGHEALRHSKGICFAVERPWHENQIFALANVLDGAMTVAQYEVYAGWYADAHEKCKPAADLPDPTLLFLWAPERTVVQRMIDRGRLDESAYDDTYLEHLAHCYFVSVLRSYLCASDLPPYLVIEWSAFGEWDAPVITGAVPGDIRYATRATLSASMRQSFLYATSSDNEEYFNLDWYINESDVTQDRSRRVVFRDTVLGDLSKRVPVSLIANARTRTIIENFYDPLTWQQPPQEVAEVITVLEQLVSHGYGYASKGSLYVDTGTLSVDELHVYESLRVTGVITNATAAHTLRRSPRDIALWRALRVGPVVWSSPWGKGAPGWNTVHAGALVAFMENVIYK